MFLDLLFRTVGELCEMRDENIVRNEVLVID